MKYSYSMHAWMRIKKRKLKLEWIENTLDSPYEILYLEDPELVYFIGKVEEFGNRYLKVAVNIKSKTIVTIHFDRNLKRRIENENKTR